MNTILLIAVNLILFGNYNVEFSNVVPKDEIVHTFTSEITQYSHQDYDWKYITLRIDSIEGDSIVTVEYAETKDLFWPQTEIGRSYYSVVGKETLLIGGNISDAFFHSVENAPNIKLRIDGSNVAVEFLPTKRYKYSLGHFILLGNNL